MMSLKGNGGKRSLHPLLQQIREQELRGESQLFRSERKTSFFQFARGLGVLFFSSPPSSVPGIRGHWPNCTNNVLSSFPQPVPNRLTATRIWRAWSFQTVVGNRETMLPQLLQLPLKAGTQLIFPSPKPLIGAQAHPYGAAAEGFAVRPGHPSE
ncbi:hypothetical protein CEXT_576531 [Caerostris extrusa]|uniref:Uncharacterized protein n=1 Tax=Caerostris extrusa TaxID=172846 RepID=A0AAV4NZL7_CAEEX|nr:hypothetical protein CEXT_576531 [Caerostris extrusa]